MKKAELSTQPVSNSRLQLDITWVTFLRGFTLILLVYILIKLSSFIGLTLIAVLLAITLEPTVQRLTRYGLKRDYAYTLVLVSVILVIVLFVTYFLPTLYGQVQAVGEKLPAIREEILNKLPQGRISREVQKVWSHPETMVGNWGKFLLLAGGFLTKTVYSLVVIVTFAFYFLHEGRRTFEWLISFFRHPNHRKLQETARAVSKIVSAYVTGQLTTSALAFLFTAIVMQLLNVPAPLMLALLAGVLDLLPVIGFLILIFFVSILALSVSATTALWACSAIIIYQAIENYLIAPRVYGSEMQLSKLAVVTALACGGLLGGPIGALLALPIAAAYPQVERIWLKRYLGEEVIEHHQQLQRDH